MNLNKKTEIMSIIALLLLTLSIESSMTSTATPLGMSEDNIVSPKWIFGTNGEVVSIDISIDGEYVVIGSNDGNLYFFRKDGTKLWSINGVNPISVAISNYGKYIIVGSFDGIHLFDKEGNELWTHKTNDLTETVAISSDGSRAIAESKDNTIYYFDRNGEILWIYGPGNKLSPEDSFDVLSVDISDDGEYFIAGDETTIHFGKPGQYFYRKNNRFNITSSISSDGKYAVVGTKTYGYKEDRYTYILRNDGETKTSSKFDSEINAVDISDNGKINMMNFW